MLSEEEPGGIMIKYKKRLNPHNLNPYTYSQKQ